MNDLRYATKLVVQDEVAENEVAVGNIVKGIVNYGVNFVPVIDTCVVNLEKVKNKRALNKCDIVPKRNKKANNDDSAAARKKFVLMKMPYIDSLHFYEYVNGMGSNKKKIISCIFDTYSYLIESIERLGEHEVVHYDLKMQNILVNLKTDTPIIIDFGLSIPVGALKNDADANADANADAWAAHFYKYSPDYYVWPLEAHVINFMQHNAASAVLTHDDVVHICEAFVNSNAGLRIFSKGFRARYLKACIEQYEPWVGATRDVVRVALLKGWATWDNYSLSIEYLQILGFITGGGITHNRLIMQYVELLLQNVHPDPARRKTVEETKRAFTDMFYMNEKVEMYDVLVENFNANAFALKTTKLSQSSLRP
jgi:serine/threonine protein kinase